MNNEIEIKRLQLNLNALFVPNNVNQPRFDANTEIKHQLVNMQSIIDKTQEWLESAVYFWFKECPFGKESKLSNKLKVTFNLDYSFSTNNGWFSTDISGKKHEILIDSEEDESTITELKQDFLAKLTEFLPRSPIKNTNP